MVILCSATVSHTAWRLLPTLSIATILVLGLTPTLCIWWPIQCKWKSSLLVLDSDSLSRFPRDCYMDLSFWGSRLSTFIIGIAISFQSSMMMVLFGHTWLELQRNFIWLIVLSHLVFYSFFLFISHHYDLIHDHKTFYYYDPLMTNKHLFMIALHTTVFTSDKQRQ